MPPVQHVRDADDFARLFDVSRETVERLEIYAALLAKWQKTINLVAPSTLGDVWHRHFADSAQVVRVAQSSSPPPCGEGLAVGGIPEPDIVVPVPTLFDWDSPPPHPSPTSWRSARCATGEGVAQLRLPVSDTGIRHWLDLGSGGGFPGLVVGIMLAEQGGWRLTLVESDQRKCAFLREVVRETALKGAVSVAHGVRMTVDIVAERIESAANHSMAGSVDVVSARALAALPQLLNWAGPFFGPETVGVFLKGRDALAEVDAARGLAGWQLELVPSLTEADARVVRVRQAGPEFGVNQVVRA